MAPGRSLFNWFADKKSIKTPIKAYFGGYLVIVIEIRTIYASIFRFPCHHYAGGSRNIFAGSVFTFGRAAIQTAAICFLCWRWKWRCGHLQQPGNILLQPGK
jgi:hypothetical protein